MQGSTSLVTCTHNMLEALHASQLHLLNQLLLLLAPSLARYFNISRGGMNVLRNGVIAEEGRPCPQVRTYDCLPEWSDVMGFNHH